MSRDFLVSTTIRYQDFGYIYLVDSSEGIIRKKKKLINQNQAAKHGGPHGLAIDGERIIVATYSDIRIFDKRLNKIDSFTHPYMTDIHGISVTDGKIWISCTNNEGIFAFDVGGTLLEEHFLTENSKLMSRIDEPVRDVDRNRDFRGFRRPYEEHPFHVNHVHEKKGRLEVSLHKQGVIWDLRENKLLAGIDSSAIHDGQSTEHGFFLNDTSNEESVFLQKNGNEYSRIDIDFYKNGSLLDRLTVALQEGFHKILHKFHLWFPSIVSPRKCHTNWVRGFLVDSAARDLSYVGGSPAAVYRLDSKRGRVTECHVLSRNLCEAVFDLSPMPE